MNLILGSGVTSFAARHILGSSYKIINAGPSRFYNHNPAPADNFILAHDSLRPLESILQPLIGSRKADYRCAWSSMGNINRGFNSGDCMSWLIKIFVFNVPNHIQHVLPNRMEFKVYENRINNLYAALFDKHKSEILGSLTIDQIKKIEPHKVVFNDGNVVEFEKMISTIPLNDLYKLIGYNDDLKSVGVSVIRLKTKSLNFEGFNQLWIVDPNIPFYKTQIVKEDEYLFYFNSKIETPGFLVAPYVQDFDLLTGMWIESAIPAGDVPFLNHLDDYGIVPVGASAQWDYCVDFSRCLFRIMQIADGAI
jgi:hypothetical protein